MTGLLDIAREAGVSISTVSRVANGKKHINPHIRERVLTLIKKTGYVPNKAARAMVLKRSFTVGMVIPGKYTLFQYRMFSLLEWHLYKFGYHTLRFFLEPFGSSVKECLSALKSENPDGIILFCGNAIARFSDYLAKPVIPIISDNGGLNTIPAVTIDNKKAAYEAVTHLICLGHRKIGMICGSDSLCVSQRAEGYYRALAENSIDYDNSYIVYEPHCTFDDGKNGMKKLLLRARDFSAIFAVTDELAIGAMGALRDEGLRVPENVSIVGFDDADISSYVIPRLTTIRQPLERMGEQTALLLHNRISGNIGTVDPIIPHTLIVREPTSLNK
jgi:LacI family transcriptional regulator